MKSFIRSLSQSVAALIYLTILLGLIYPLFMWGVGTLFFSSKANGTLLYNLKGNPVGSEWIAQSFTGDRYFHPRASAAGKGYDASNSSGSNLGPTSQKLIDTIQKRVKAYRLAHKWNGPIPADAVTGSGSGLDPHISVANARIQSGRVASARGIPQSDVEQLIKRYTESRTLGIFGEARVNVLRINLALDQR